MRITPNLRARIRAHAWWFGDLPEVTVESAAVSDEDTTAWSRESYARDLEIERKPRTGEQNGEVA